MLARRIGGALRLAAAAVAVAAVAAAGGLLASLASAGQPLTCDDGAVTTVAAPEEAAPDCPETTSPPTATETAPVTEPSPEELPPVTDTVAPELPPPPVTPTVAPPLPDPAPVQETVPSPPTTTTTTESTPPVDKKPTKTPTGNATFGSGARVASVPQNGQPRLGGGPYVFPVLGSSSFGDTWGAARTTVGWHHGVDIFAPRGAPIVAVADGVLFSVGWNAIGGRRLWLRDREGNYFYFAHLSAFAEVAADGARVLAGTVIGYVGDSGDAEGTPPHLHFEVHPVSLLSLGYDGAVNPFPYVSAWRRLDEAARAGEASAAAPAPGAILLGFTDISSAVSLSPASLDERPSLEKVVVAAPPVVEPEERREALPLLSGDDGGVARSLDLEASRPAVHASVWDALAACESGGNWGANTGNGFVGGLQFLPQTWASHGGLAFARTPNLATREQQITIAERVLETQGWRAWPSCSVMLGLPALANR